MTAYICRPPKHTGRHLDEWVHKCSKKPPHYDLFPPEVTAPVCFRGQTPHREATFGASIQRTVSWLAKGLKDCRNSSVEELYDLNLSNKNL